MRKPSFSGGSETPSSRETTEAAIRSIENTLGTLNIDVSDAAPNFDSVVVFSTTDNDPIATPIATLDGIGSTELQRHFRDNSVMEYRLRKHGTALGDALASPHAEPFFAQSRVNPDDNQITFAHPLVHDGELVGAAQYSFSEHYSDEGLSLPDTQTLERIWDKYAKNTTQVAASIAGLQRMAKDRRKTLPTMLHKKPALAPNSFLIRWDVEGATALNASDQQPLLDDYLNDAHVALNDLTQEYVDDPEKSYWNIRQAYSDQGDGAYITLMIPDGFNTYDKHTLRNYRNGAVRTFMAEAARRLELLAADQPDGFRPVVHMNGEFGYTEANGVGRLNSTTMYSLAARQKKI